MKPSHPGYKGVRKHHPPGTMSREPPPIVRLVGARVDRLQIAYGAPVDVAQILATKGIDVKGERYRVERQRARGRALGLAGPGVDVEAGTDIAIVDLRAPYLATHSPGEGVALTEQIARAMCPGHWTDSGRVRAIDLCADIAGTTFDARDLGAFVTRLRGADTFRTRQRRTAGDPVVTGLSIGNPKAILVTIYNKSAELRQKHATERAGMEGFRWTERGWDGRRDVWRVEVKLRGSILREYGLCDPAKLVERIDAVWRAMVTKVVRLVDLSSATRRERCGDDPRWGVLQRATFVHVSASPAMRNRGPLCAPTVAAMMGTVAAVLASRGVPRVEAEKLIGAIVAKVGTLDDIAALPARLESGMGACAPASSAACRPGPAQDKPQGAPEAGGVVPCAPCLGSPTRRSPGGLTPPPPPG